MIGLRRHFASNKGQRQRCGFWKEVYVTEFSDVRSYLSESVRLVKLEVLAYLGYCAALIGRFGTLQDCWTVQDGTQ